MGKKPYSVESIFDKRPLISEYDVLPHDVRKFVDKLIQTSLKSNKILRVDGKNKHPIKQSLWLLSWNDIILIREYVIERNIVEVLKIIYKLSSEKFNTLDLFNCFAVYKWINEELEAIANLEKQELYDEPTNEEKEAGVNKLQEFGSDVTIDNLCNGNPIIEEIMLKKPYIVIFKRLCLRKVKREISEEYAEIMKRKK